MYVSLSAYGATTLENSLNTLQAAGVSKVQLSVGVKPQNHLHILREYPFKYTAHSNFPLDENQANYDLVSNPGFLANFERILEFCANHNIPSYSFHTGKYHNSMSSKDAYDRFVENLTQVSTAAKGYGINIAVETMYPTNTPVRWVLDNQDEILKFLQTDLSVGIVLDLAHVHIGVVQGTMTPGIVDTLMTHKRLSEVHISTNDGRLDIHQPLPDTWTVPMAITTGVPVVYEGRMNGWPPSRVKAHLAQISLQVGN